MRLDMTEADYRRLTGRCYDEGRSKVQKMMPAPAGSKIVPGKSPGKPKKYDYVQDRNDPSKFGEINSMSRGYAYVRFGSGKSFDPVEISSMAYLGMKGHKHVWIERMPWDK